MIYQKKEKSALIDIPITKYDFLGQYLRLNFLILIIINKISSSEMKIQYHSRKNFPIKKTIKK